MSETYAQAETNVRLDLRDPSTGKQVVSQDTIRRALNLKVTQVGDSLALRPSWVSHALTLTTAASTYSLADAKEYGEVVELRYSSAALGLPYSLVKVSPERMRELRNVTTIPTARPSYYSLELQSDQTIAVTFDSTPAAGEYVDALVSLMPEDWAADSTGGTIPYSKRACRAVELMAASAIGHSLTGEQLNAMRLNPATFVAWERDAQTLLTKEWIALSNLRLDHGPTQLGWVLAWRKE